MRFGVLGPVEVRRDGLPVGLGGPKQRAVLAHLIVRANQVVPAETLIDLVWGDDPPEAARNSLQSYVSHLRKALGADRLEGRPPGYVLHASPDEVDASIFEGLLAEASGADGDADRAASILREALALWRGPPFADLAGEPTLGGEITRLDELRLRALERRLDADLMGGRHGELIGELEAITREHPLRERLWASLMLALYRSGRQADALGAFQRARELLAEELGVDPSAELRSLHERILRQDPDLEIRGEPLRGYRLLEQVGEGTFGVVHRAVQSHVGREVAVKVIHPELANRPDFVRRFEREAQLVARLEHPHVVPLYDYWRDPGGAYLVMRFLRGGSLESLLDGRGLEVGRAAAILDQVAGALSAAHRQGVVHRDVKPGNVLLDEEGNAYLSDFGIALELGAPEPSRASMQGTPAYLSPEQIGAESTTPQSDVYALGVLLFEMLVGEPPFAGASLEELFEHHLRDPLPSVARTRPQLPAAVDRVIERATAKDPAARFADVRELAEAFRAAIEAPGGLVTVEREVRNPYKGLRAFAEADAADFFGRESVVRRLVERLAEHGDRRRFLCIVGPSGSGKSSVVRAGLVPALRAGALAGSDRWFFVDVAPGRHPLRELESAMLGVAVRPPPSLLEDLERDELGLVRAAHRILPDAEAELVIVLDQLEELFTLADDEERAQVLDLVRAAAETPGSRVRVVTTLRADLFDQPLSVRGFGDLLADRTEVIPPMSPEQLERAVTAPAERAGLRIEPGLVAAIVADVADRPGALPLLQYALTELAERRTDDTLTIGSYEQIGGVSGAVARRAEQLFEPLHARGQEACRQLFLRLVTIGEGGEVTRRRMRRSELLSLADGGVMDAVVETFGRHRLLSFDRDPATREPTVEIAHEAILRAWGRVREWIDTSREELQVHARIAAAAEEWDRAGRSVEDLLAGTKLAQAEDVAASDSISLTETERAYVEAGLARRDAEVEAERQRREHERRLERRALTRLRALVAVLAAASVVAATLTIVTVDRTRQAELSALNERVGGLTAASVASLETDPQRSLLLALYAVEAAAASEVPAATAEALHWAIQESGIEYPADGPVAVVAGPLGRRGIVDLPIPQLANLARNNLSYSPTSEECERFLGAATCPPLPSEFEGDLRAETVRAAAPTSAGRPLAGTQVRLFTPFLEKPWPTDLRRELAAFEARTGIQVSLTIGPDDFELWIRERTDAGDAPELSLFPQPGLVAAFARAGHLIDLGTYVDVEQLVRDQSPYLVSLGRVGSEGSSTDDGLFGAFADVNVKSLIWYPAEAFRAAGYDVPKTWNELMALSDQLVTDGNTPWCIAFESGGASGWPGTDLIENLVLAGSGPRAYDRWAAHEIPFDSPAVRAAFHRLDRLLFRDGYVYGGTDGAATMPFDEALDPMADQDPPGCWLHQGGDFMAKLLPEGSVGTEFDAFPFPTNAPESSGFVMGGGSLIAAFADRPEVREVVRFLLSPQYGLERAGLGHGFVSANRRFDVSTYQPFDRERAEAVQQALANDTFRFDASDLMPPEVGVDLFWVAMMTYLREGPQSLDRILTELDATWPGG